MPSTKNDNLVAFLGFGGRAVIFILNNVSSSLKFHNRTDINVESCFEDGVLIILPPFVVDAPFLSCNFHRFDSRTGFWTLFFLTFIRLKR